MCVHVVMELSRRLSVAVRVWWLCSSCQTTDPGSVWFSDPIAEAGVLVRS